MWILIPMMLLFAFSACGQNRQNSLPVRKGVVVDSIESENDYKFKYSFSTLDQYDPITFIDAVSRTIEVNNGLSSVGISMVDEFPIDWVKEEHIDTLISMLNSKDTCGCYLNPLSSYIPNDFADKGGYAGIFIKAYKERKPVSLGLYLCPKVDQKLNEELVSWWEKQKNE